MGRFFGPDTEIARAAHKPLAEMMQPDAIHINAGSKGVIRTGNRPSQIQTSAAIGERWPAWLAQYFEKAPGHFVPEVAGIASLEHVRIVWRGAIYQRHRAWRRSGMRPAQCLD